MPSSPNRNLSLVVCAVLHGLTHALQLILPPLYLSIRDDFGLAGLGPVMLFGTIYFVTYGATGLPYGILADRFSKKRILVLGTLVNSLAFLLAAGTRSYAVFVAAMILGGIGGGTYHPVANALIANLFKGTVGRAFGLIGMGASFGLFFGPFASGYLGQQLGWRVSCAAFALFGCIVAVAFWVIMPEEEKAAPESKAAGMSANTYFVALVPVIMVFGLRDFCLWGATYLTPAMSEMNLGFSKDLSGMLIGLMSLTGIVSQPLAGNLSDRIGRRRMIFVFLLSGGIAVSLFPFLTGMTIFAAALLGGFMLLGTVPVIDAAAADIVPPAVRGKVFGVLMTLGIMFGALSPYLVGLIHDLFGGYRLAYLTLGTAGTAGALLVFTIPQKRAYRS